MYTNSILIQYTNTVYIMIVYRDQSIKSKAISRQHNSIQGVLSFSYDLKILH